MILNLKFFLLLSLFIFSSLSFANTSILVFLEDAPLRFIKVSIDGKIVGVSDKKGIIQTNLSPGPHRGYLISDDNAVLFTFDLPVNGEVEITATYTRDVEVDPEVTLNVFDEGETALGFIAGLVTSEDGIPLEGVTISDPADAIKAVTDENGLYSMEAPRGIYRLQATVDGYEMGESPELTVFADLGVNATFKLAEISKESFSEPVTSQKLEEVVTLGVFNPTEDAESLERYASTIVSAVDADQISRFGDGDVAAVLGRIVGLSVVDDKYANVRGLDGRYISTKFNNILMPSTDPLRRDVQLDLFPSNIVDSIQVQKSFSASELASTTGGSISVITKGMPEERGGNLSVSIGANAEFTGDSVQGYRDSIGEKWGYDAGLRDLHTGVIEATNGGQTLTICDPDVLGDLCTRPEVALAYALTMKPDYDVRSITADPDVGIDGSYGDVTDLFDGSLGYYIAGSYGRATSYRGDAQLTNPVGLIGQYDRTKDNVAISGYGFVGYEFDTGKLSSKTTLLRSTDDVTRQTSALDNNEENVIDSVILEYTERQLFSQSIEGEHDLVFNNFESLLNWRIGYSETDRLEPDRRGYYGLDGFLATSSVQRRWSDLNEVSHDIGFDYSFSFDWGSANYSTLSFGALISEKDRTVDLYRFGIRQGSKSMSLDMSEGVDEILSIVNFAADRFRLRGATTPTDSYESSEEIAAYYVNMNNEIGDNWIAEVGFRYEDFSQLIRYPNKLDSSNLLEADSFYPALNVSYLISDELQLRLGFSQTVSYPGLIERSDSQSFDPTTDDPIFGSPNLVVSEIDNFDARLEYYFGEENRLSLALFNKSITNPIETAIADASGTSAAGITFRNQLGADLNGIELDFSIIALEDDEKELFVNGNISFIDSEVQLGAVSLRLEGEGANGRKLQGQSEYLANLQIGFDHFPTSQKFTLLANYFDDRIFRVARGAALGPIVEKGRAVIDANYEKAFGDSWTLKAKVKNLTNEPVTYMQNVNDIEFYEMGTSVNISLSYSL